MKLAAVVPTSIDRAKRLAKALHSAYPSSTLAKCQALTAQLLFHKDWHALEQAIKQKIASAPFDSECNTETVTWRYATQCQLLCTEMHEVDMLEDYPPPPLPDMNKLAGLHYVIGGSSSFYYRDLFIQATRRWSQQYVKVLIGDELTPTAAASPPALPLNALATPFKFMNLLEWLPDLPNKLENWWKRNFPREKEEALNLKKLELNPYKASSVLRFARYWGEMCFFYSASLTDRFMMGTAYLIGFQYGALYMQKSDAYKKLLSAPENISEADWTLIEAAVSDALFEGIIEFFDVYPVPHLHGQFNVYPITFDKAGAHCVKILNNPTSHGGRIRD